MLKSYHIRPEIPAIDFQVAPLIFQLQVDCAPKSKTPNPPRRNKDGYRNPTQPYNKSRVGFCLPRSIQCDSERPGDKTITYPYRIHRLYARPRSLYTQTGTDIHRTDSTADLCFLEFAQPTASCSFSPLGEQGLRTLAHRRS